jgi:hypothetical protein
MLFKVALALAAAASLCVALMHYQRDAAGGAALEREVEAQLLALREHLFTR